MKRIAWEIILALIVGLGLGLVYAWIIAPVEVVDAVPSALRADFKDQYRAVIAASYAANHDLTRAQSRLSLLGEADSYALLSAQAQRALSSGDSLQSVQLAELASALHGNVPARRPVTATSRVVQAFTPQVMPSKSTSPIATPFPTLEIDILPVYTATPRPTPTPIPAPAAPFELAAQEQVCDDALTEGLLQVWVQQSNRRPIPGMELILSWAGGEEHFFTGLKPEVSNGYADAHMSAGVTYSLRAATGGVVVEGLTAPACQMANGETYLGGIKIILQRP